MDRYLILALFAILAGCASEIRASAMPSGVCYAADSLDYAVLSADSDSAGIAEIRARMDSIRSRRPVIALVLSGGGAKGAAHIGAMKYLESIDMPVDMVLGTSMGGLVGGIYALGYSIEDLESIVRNIDWELALSDRIPREFVSYSEKKYKEKYLLSFPFYYRKEYYLEQKADELRYSDGDSPGTDEEEVPEMPEQFERTDVQRHDGKLQLGADSQHHKGQSPGQPSFWIHLWAECPEYLQCIVSRVSGLAGFQQTADPFRLCGDRPGVGEGKGMAFRENHDCHALHHVYTWDFRTGENRRDGTCGRWHEGRWHEGQLSYGPRTSDGG